MMVIRDARRTAGLAVLALLLSSLALVTGARADAAEPRALESVTPSATPVPSGWTWTNYGPELMSISCITDATCVAVGQGGAVLRSPNTAEVPLAWTFVDLVKDPSDPDNPVDLVGVSCSTTSCLAVSAPLTPTVTYGSWVYRSTDGGATWAAVQQLPMVAGAQKTNVGAAVTCAPDPDATADTRQCYIVGLDGGIWRSTNDGRTWAGIPLPTTAPKTTSFDKVACSGPSTCVAAGGDSVPSSALISGTTVRLLKTPIGITKSFAALACDGPRRCVGTGGEGGYSIMIMDASPNWGNVQTFRRNPLQAGVTVKVLDCPIKNTCIGLDKDGGLLRTDALSTPTVKWSMRPVPMIIGALDCVGSACRGVGKAAAWFASPDLGSTFRRVNQVAEFDLAVCGGTLDAACIAGGKENVGRSITGGTLWTLPVADRGALNVKAIRCETSLVCSFFGQTEVLATRDMNVFRPRFGPVQSAAGSDAQTCVTDDICVAVNESVVYTTFDGGRTQWSSNQFPKVRPMGITCLPGVTDPVTCLVAVKYNILIGTMTQDAQGLPHWDWEYTNADADEVINTIGCVPNARECVAVGMAGQIMTSTGDLMNWTEQTIPEGVPVSDLPVYSSVTCPRSEFCMVGGKHGAQTIVTSTVDGFATYSYDAIGDLRAAPGVSGFACESVNRCIAVGSTVLLGIRTPPVSP